MNALMEGQEIERKRIAEDLHDRLGSMLSTIKLYFHAFENKIAEFKSGGNSQYLKASKILDEAVLEVRRISHNITSSVLMKFGLVAALRDLGDTLESTEQIKVNVVAFGVDERLDNRIEVGLYRITQELINNILKHANATEMIIRLNQKKDLLTMTIIDDGVGFDVEEAKKKKGMGLYNVAVRAKQINGTLKITSKKGKGCKTIINIMLN